MARFELTAPDGSRYEMTAPDGATEQEIYQVFAQQFGQAQPPPERQQSALESFGRGALQGATFGFSDEIGGVFDGVMNAGGDLVEAGRQVAMAPMTAMGQLLGYEPQEDAGQAIGKAYQSFNEGYNQGVDEIRAANDAAFNQNPVSYIGGEFTGAVASTAIPVVGQVGRVAQGANLAQKSYAGAKAGAKLGALSGFGHSRGGVDERATGAGVGAAGGAVLGGTLPAALNSGRAAIDAIGTRIQATRDPVGRGRAMLAQALADDLGQAGTNPAVAARRMNDRLAGSQGQLGDPRVMDVGGENTRNLLRAAANQKSPGAETLRKTLDARQANQWRRLERGVLKLVQGRNVEPEEAVERLIDRARTKSKPFFDAAFKTKLPVTQKLLDVLDRPGTKRLVELAQEAALNEGKDLSRASPVELLHRVKMQIDRQISATKRGVQDSKANWDVRTLVQLKKDLVDAIDVPAYKKALKTYSGSASIRSALQDGLDEGLRETPEFLRRKMATMSRQEKMAYRYGVARAFVQKMREGNVNRDRTGSVFGSPDNQKIIDLIAETPQAKREFQKLLVVESKMAATRRAVQGNSTTAKQLTQMDESAQALGSVQAASQMALGRVAPILNDLSRRIARIGGMTPEVANEVIRAAMRDSVSSVELQKAIARAANSGSGLDDIARMLLRGGVAAGNSASEPRGLTGRTTATEQTFQ